MSNEPPSRRPGASGDWDADAPDAWDEPEVVRASDQHGRQAREDAGPDLEHGVDQGGDHSGDHDDRGLERGPDQHDGGYGYEDHAEYDEHGRYDEQDGHGEYDEHGYAGDDAGHDEPPYDESSGTARKPVWRRLVVFAVALALVVGGVAVGVGLFRPIYQQFTAPKDYEGAGQGQVEVVVEPGDTGLEIGQRLQQAGVVLTAGAFTQAIQDNPGDELQPGHYALRKEMQAAQALSLMRNEGRNTTRVTIREGLWKSEVYAELSKVTQVPVAQYQAAEKRIQDDPSIVGLPEAAKGNIEGYLFPATYDFDPGTDAISQLRTMVAHATSQLRSLNVPPANMERVMTVASLVEGEARTDEDGPKVARVIENRLKANMPLQMDSTVNYAAQRRSITTSDEERAATSPYNTYRHPGLPPGPINNPGAKSINAAQNPVDGPWLYFVTVDPGTGETVFTTTLDEHNVQVRRFQQWCQANPGKC